MELVIPFVGPFEPLWVGLEIIALYLMSAATVTFYLIRRIGNRAFRLIHLTTYLGFAMVLLHSVQAGTDSALLMPLYLGSGAIVLFCTFFRIFRS